MKCELCHKNDAETVLLRLTEAGKQEELYVCTACATRERAFEQQHGIQVAAMDATPFPGDATDLEAMSLQGDAPMDEDFPMPPPLPAALTDHLMPHLGDFFGKDPERPRSSPDELITPKTCPKCGMAADELNFALHLGCAQCYEVFREELKNLFADMQKCTEYKGPAPAWMANKFREKELMRQLKQAIAENRFDDAKRLTQEIKALRGQKPNSKPPQEDGDEA